MITVRDENTNDVMIEEARIQAQNMMLSLNSFSNDCFDPYDIASALHNIVRLSEKLGQEGVALRTKILRKKLADQAPDMFLPEEDFIFVGPYICTLGALFLPCDEKKALAEKMAFEDASSIAADAIVNDDDVRDTLVRFASLDDDFLDYYCAALASALEIKEFMGFFTVLRDESLLSLHYIENCEEEFSDI